MCERLRDGGFLLMLPILYYCSISSFFYFCIIGTCIWHLFLFILVVSFISIIWFAMYMVKPHV